MGSPISPVPIPMCLLTMVMVVLAIFWAQDEPTMPLSQLFLSIFLTLLSPVVFAFVPFVVTVDKDEEDAILMGEGTTFVTRCAGEIPLRLPLENRMLLKLIREPVEPTESRSASPAVASARLESKKSKSRPCEVKRLWLPSVELREWLVVVVVAEEEEEEVAVVVVPVVVVLVTAVAAETMCACREAAVNVAAAATPAAVIASDCECDWREE